VFVCGYVSKTDEPKATKVVSYLFSYAWKLEGLFLRNKKKL
jgi:hypothetical protein